MKALLTTDLAFVAILTMGITGLSPDRCLAADPVCVTNSGSTERVCVEWGKQAPPEEDDFDVDYSCQGCSDAPDVELKTGDTGWVMYSEVISSGVAANIGALTTTDSDNYGVKIAKGTAAGAANVGSMVLSPDGASYSSSILSGSKISGDLTGNLTLQKSSGGEGGAVTLRSTAIRRATSRRPTLSTSRSAAASRATSGARKSASAISPDHCPSTTPGPQASIWKT